MRSCWWPWGCCWFCRRKKDGDSRPFSRLNSWAPSVPPRPPPAAPCRRAGWTGRRRIPSGPHRGKSSGRPRSPPAAAPPGPAARSPRWPSTVWSNPPRPPPSPRRCRSAPPGAGSPPGGCPLPAGPGCPHRWEWTALRRRKMLPPAGPWPPRPGRSRTRYRFLLRWWGWCGCFRPAVPGPPGSRAPGRWCKARASRCRRPRGIRRSCSARSSPAGTGWISLPGPSPA